LIDLGSRAIGGRGSIQRFANPVHVAGFAFLAALDTVEQRGNVMRYVRTIADVSATISE